MSDEAGAAPAAAEQHSTPEAQVQPPAPIESTGPQPDPKPEPKAEPKAEAKPSTSISEALKKAEAKVKADGEAKAPPKAPEKADKAEVKAEPKAEAKEVKSDGPVRGEDGKFASKEPKAEAKPDAPWRETPKRFSEDGKRDWENAPDSVKAETHRAIRELESGINEYKQKYEPLKQYDDLARQNNTTVKDALDRYTTLEKQLSSGDPNEKWSALQKVFDYAGINVREFAAQISGAQLNRTEAQHEAEKQQLRTRNAELEHELSGYRAEKEKNLMNTVDEFAAQNPRFDELSSKVAKLLESGLAENLQEAYAMADRLIPAANKAPAQPPVTPEPAAHTPAKSLTGSPSPGSSPATRKPSNSINEALKRAMAQVG